MSLDVYLTQPGVGMPRGSGIFVRQGGSIVEITRAEWDAAFPGREPTSVEDNEGDEVFSANITHNLGKMATAAGIYDHLWRPDEHGITKAGELIAPLSDGLIRLRADPARFEALNPENGWGSYANFVPWVERYLSACEQYPDATVSVSR